MLAFYPVILLGAVAVAVGRRGYDGGRGWLWFAAWLGAGALFAFSLATGFSIGLVILPLAAIALLAVAWLSPHLREAAGFVAGVALLVGALVAVVAFV